MILSQFLNNEFSREIELKVKVINLISTLAFRWWLCHHLSLLGSVVQEAFHLALFGFIGAVCYFVESEFQDLKRSYNELVQLLFYRGGNGSPLPLNDLLMITKYLATGSDWLPLPVQWSFHSRGMLGRESEIRHPEVLSLNGRPYFTHPSTQVLPPTGVSAEMEITVPRCSMPAR